MNISTRTVIVGDESTNEVSNASIFGNNVNFKLPKDLDSKLEKEMQYIYTKNKPEDILNITVTPIMAIFDKFMFPVKYIIIYTYKYD